MAPIMITYNILLSHASICIRNFSLLVMFVFIYEIIRCRQSNIALDKLEEALTSLKYRYDNLDDRFKKYIVYSEELLNAEKEKNGNLEKDIGNIYSKTLLYSKVVVIVAFIAMFGKPLIM